MGEVVRPAECIYMNKAVWVALFTLTSSGFGNLADAQARPDSYAPAPAPPGIFSQLQAGGVSNAFNRQVRLSGLMREDMDGGYITLLVPEDKGCLSGRDDLKEEDTRAESARRYVFRHAFRGQLAIYRVDGRLVSVNYFPDVNSLDGRIQIDEAHPLAIPLLDGSTVLASVRKDAVVFGGNASMTGDMGGLDGMIVKLDHCAIY